MKSETRDKLYEIVRSMVDNKVNSMIEDMSMDNTFEKNLIDKLQEEEIDDLDSLIDEIDGLGDYGEMEGEHIENLIDSMTESFMKRFEA
jgi:hypothetical protein